MAHSLAWLWNQHPVAKHILCDAGCPSHGWTGCCGRKMGVSPRRRAMAKMSALSSELQFEGSEAPRGRSGGSWGREVHGCREVTMLEESKRSCGYGRDAAAYDPPSPRRSEAVRV
jgi:hypothetical protein